jgi:hypothetical protein
LIWDICKEIYRLFIYFFIIIIFLKVLTENKHT